MLDPFADPFNPVTPAAVPLPRGPSPVGPIAYQQAAAGKPRIVMTGAARSTGDEPLSRTPVAPKETIPTDGGDPYADVPRLQPRTGFRRELYNATSGLASGSMMADPISGFADSYLGAQRSEADQTAAERTAQIDEINRQVEIQNARAAAAEKQRVDTADIDEKEATAAWRKAQAANGGGGAAGNGETLTEQQYQNLLVKKEIELQSAEHVTGPPGVALYDDELAAAKARVKAQMDAYKLELAPRVKGYKPPPPDDVTGGADRVDQGSPKTVDELQGALQRRDGRPPTADPGMMKREVTTRSIKTPNGAYPDNISGTGSLKDPFRVKDSRDPTLKAKIKVGDYFVYVNPQSGKEEIRVRSR